MFDIIFKGHVGLGHACTARNILNELKDLWFGITQYDVQPLDDTIYILIHVILSDDISPPSKHSSLHSFSCQQQPPIIAHKIRIWNSMYVIGYAVGIGSLESL